MGKLTIRGFEIWKDALPVAAQHLMVDDLRQVLKRAPLFTPRTPSGKAMSVRMSAAGQVGWVSDHKGYRYEPRHPSGVEWPDIPDSVLSLWQQVSGVDRSPECCLINYYGEDARMGLHQDKDEADFSWPVVSISLGDDGLFRMGNPKRGGKTESIWLGSGDVVVMGGTARLAYHGVDRIRFGSSRVLPRGGRINLTLRVVR